MHQKRGFTLIELLVVFAIISVLAAVIAVNVSSAGVRARDTQRKNDLKQIQLALELYRQDNGSYPYVRGCATTVLQPYLVPKYITTMPSDPKYGTACMSAIYSFCYGYNPTTLSPATGYWLTVQMENNNETFGNPNVFCSPICHSVVINPPAPQCPNVFFTRYIINPS